MSEIEHGKTLLDIYLEIYKEHYGNRPVVNQTRGKWFFADLVDELGSPKRVMDLINYYFKTTGTHDLVHFMNNYHKVINAKKLMDDDRKRTQRLLAETKERVKKSGN